MRSCCGCGSLRMGTIVVGFITIIASVCVILAGVMIICNQNPEPLSKTLLISVMMWFFFMIIMTTLMIYGSVKTKYMYMLGYIALGLADIIFLFIVMVACILLSIFRDPEVAIGHTVSSIVIAVIIPLQTYFWFVVYSFFAELSGIKTDRVIC